MRSVDGQRDPTMRLLRELQTDVGREREGLFVAEGEELVRRAFDYGAEVVCLTLSDRLARTAQGAALAAEAEAAGASVCTASLGLIGKMLGTQPAPDRAAIVHRRLVSLNETLAGDCPLIIMVERCENADNLGMLLRSADAAGVDGVVLTGDTTDPFGRRAVRASRGAVFSVPICICPDSLAAVASARAARPGLRVIATSAGARKPYTDVDLGGPAALVVGNEHVGVSDPVKNASDEVARIPMRGRVNSLNIAAAASVMIYEALRQRNARDR